MRLVSAASGGVPAAPLVSGSRARGPQPSQARPRLGPSAGACFFPARPLCRGGGTWLVAEAHGSSVPGGSRGLGLAAGPPAHWRSGLPRGRGGHSAHALPSRRRPGTPGPPRASCRAPRTCPSPEAARSTAASFGVEDRAQPREGTGNPQSLEPRGGRHPTPLGRSSGLTPAGGDKGVPSGEPEGNVGAWGSAEAGLGWSLGAAERSGPVQGSRRHSPTPHADGPGREPPAPGWPLLGVGLKGPELTGLPLRPGYWKTTSRPSRGSRSTCCAGLSPGSSPLWGSSPTAASAPRW